MMMSDFKWSNDQILAINTTDSNVLLSAGAGSGKTAVLTERIYQLVKKGADLSRFLILTFTKAASAEMKTRIRKRILEDDSLGDLSSVVESAHIETFDSFALFLVKKYAFRLGVSPKIQIIDKTLLDIKRNKIRDDLLTHLYLQRNSDFLSLISNYCVKNDQQIRSFINELCLKAEMHTNKKEYLDNFIDYYFDEKRLNSFIDDKYEAMKTAINKAINLTGKLEDIDDVALIENSLSDLLLNGTDFDKLVLLVNGFVFPKKSSKSISNKALRDSIKNSLFKVLISENEFGTRKEIIEQFMSTKKYVVTLINIVKEIENRLDSFKKEKSSYSFGDVASFALKALDMEDIRQEMRDYFQYILVDEYQDTSALQELVINKLERNNVCMVGDIKQSIYRFRMADCTLFQYKYDLYKDNKGGKLINLNTSYRSRKEIVDIVNEMFERLMTPDTNPIDYKNGHNFEYGFKTYDSFSDNNEDYKLKVYKYLSEKGKPASDTECRMIAQDIIYKINNGYIVYDSGKREFRKCSFKDFAIIVDKGKTFDNKKAILSEYGIPSKVIYNEPVRDSEIVMVLKNLLVLFNSCLHETYDEAFKHAFVSISRSFLWSSSDQEIYDVIKEDRVLQSQLIAKINKLVESDKDKPLFEILNDIVDDFEIYQKINTIKKFSNNANKIELFINISKSMDELGIDLEGLISYLDDLNNFDLEIDYSDKDVNEDSVTIITIHRSKGLEYPIVYMPDLTSLFKHGNATSFIMDEKYGPVLPLTGFTDKSSLFNHLIKMEESKANFEERLRLLYVAITRARERLILFYKQKENGDPEIYDPIYENSFRSLIHYLNLEYKYGVDFQLENNKLIKMDNKAIRKDVSKGSVSVSPSEISVKRASKEEDDGVSQSLLEFGNEIHYLLEIADYQSKDTSFISDDRLRSYINNVLGQKIFENVKNTQVLHEYSFFDEKNNVHGIIDCLVIKDDEIDIIDFKLKNIEDEKYVLQLNTYKDYIKQTTSLPIKMYLISAITGEVKEIE